MKKDKDICPNCGRVNKKTINKRIRLIILGVIIIFGVIRLLNLEDNELTNQSNKEIVVVDNQEEKIEEKIEEIRDPIIATVDEIIEALDNNALRASKTYKGQYIKLKGKLLNIDSDGDYFFIGILSDKFSLDTVLCKIKKEHLDAVMKFEDNQEVTVIGTIIDTGDNIRYTLEVEYIE